MSIEIQAVAVLGAGTMGHGIAQICAMVGSEVHLMDADPRRVDEALRRIGANLDGAVERGKTSPDARIAALERIQPSLSIRQAVADADLVVEAVPERFELKVQVFGEVEEHAPTHTLLATNTSSLSVSDLQAQLERPERVLGMHFFNPVHINRLVEIVRGRSTDESAVETAVAYARALGKEPILVNDAPGFATSRLGVLLGLEAMRMVEEGVASAADIDRAMELGYRHPMGPLRLSDLIGLDVRLDIATYLHERLGAEHFRPPEILRNMVREGRLGQKTGEGFYRWEA